MTLVRSFEQYSGLLGALATLIVAIPAIVQLYHFVKNANMQAAFAVKQNHLLAYSTITDRIFSVDQLFISNPKMRKYFYEGKTPDSTTLPIDEYNIILTIGDYMLDFCSTLLEHKRLLSNGERTADTTDQNKAANATKPTETDGISWKEWDNYITNCLNKSPVMCKILLERLDEYESTLANMAPFASNEIYQKRHDELLQEGATNSLIIDEIIKSVFPISGGKP